MTRALLARLTSPFSARSLELEGEVTRLPLDIDVNPTNGWAGFEVSKEGTLVYRTAPDERVELVWMDERSLDPSRVYLLKHSTRTVSAEIDHAMELNQIAPVTVSTARPILFDRYSDNRGTGNFILIDPVTNFTAGAGMISDAVLDGEACLTRPNAAERLAHLARSAATDAEAVEAVRAVLGRPELDPTVRQYLEMALNEVGAGDDAPRANNEA